jgi:aldehyde dehydrogenase (NAD+)
MRSIPSAPAGFFRGCSQNGLEVARQLADLGIATQRAGSRIAFDDRRALICGTGTLRGTTMIEKREFYIDGTWVAPAQSNDCDVIDPATEETCAVISLGAKADVDKAVTAARRAFPAWAATPLDVRIALLEKLDAIMQRRIGELGEAISLEMGAPIDFAVNDQAACGPWHLGGFLEAAKSFKWEEPFAEGQVIIREPIGVCGLITPWNWPINQIALKVIPALLTGCTCVLKPSEIAPLSAILFAEFIDEAGFPAGVFNMVNGDGPGVGEAMSHHPDIDMMSFTGSTRAGALVTKGSADTVKRVTLELGGKSPNIIFADANLERAIRGGVNHCMENTGQSCNAPTRMLVENSIYEDAIDIAKKAADDVKVGNPRDHGGHIGPLVSQVHFNKVQGLIETGIAEGARLVTGGMGRPDGLNRGYFVRPTVFADVNNQMTIAREEVFGPVLVMIPFEGEEEAVEIANDTPYGLAAYLSTGDAEKGQRVGRKLRAGMVRVNGGGLAAGHPFGGYKQSGNGREGGKWGLEDFLETKILSVR